MNVIVRASFQDLRSKSKVPPMLNFLNPLNSGSGGGSGSKTMIDSLVGKHIRATYRKYLSAIVFFARPIIERYETKIKLRFLHLVDLYSYALRIKWNVLDCF